MVIPMTDAIQIVKYFHHRNSSINSKHTMKLKEILGKDKWNQSNVGNGVDTADHCQPH